ncbi:LOW QUALITY PROTEIN: hypothetical protein CVT26_006759 [Gymnopilus dilepis]|uniref:Uncharacterized protein n=1 Tax=Gymnopilus dilepis TaxID=231916 RepID=A0A409W6M8_9AGAR|nr:LOW QUALITY PROTEIN: hypothetical protein CVT26_006759 [Gymnopilus dilepis]
MLLDLEKLRSLRLMDSNLYGDPAALSPPAFKAKYGLPGGDGKGRYDNVRLGDQGYWWAIVDYYPDIFEPLSYDFEVSSCLLDTYLTGLGNELTPMDDELSRLIHLTGTPQENFFAKTMSFAVIAYMARMYTWIGPVDSTNGLNMRWGAALAYHKGFKWIWLNQGRDEYLTQLLTVDGILFADQLEASRRMKTWHT